MRDGQVLASLAVADTWWLRTRGLLGRDGVDGALLLRPARSVHTLGMRFPIDVAFCDDARRREVSRKQQIGVARVLLERSRSFDETPQLTPVLDNGRT